MEEGRDERAGRRDAELRGGVEPVVAARGAHHEAGPHAADGGADGCRDQACADLCCAVALDRLEVDRHIVEHREDGHGDEPVRQAGARHGAVQQEAHGDDGLGGVAVFDDHESEQAHRAQRQRGVNQRMAPGDGVAAAVETEEQQHERGAERRRAREVDALDLTPVVVLDRDPDREYVDHERQHDERHLDVERPPPAEAVVDEAAQHATYAHAGAVDQVRVALPQTPLAQRDQIRRDECRQRVYASSSCARDESSGDDPAAGGREATDQRPDREEGVGKDDTCSAAEDIRQATRKRLGCGVGEEVARCDPGEQCAGVKGLADWRREGRDYGPV